MSSSAVTVTGLHKRFGQVQAVNGLSFSAQRGKLTAVLGPNGAGKSTTLALIEGHLRADQGSVDVLGVNPATASAQLRPRVGVMLQEGGMPTSVSARSLMRHVASFYKSPLSVDALADLLGIADFAGTPIRRLSGGEQRRVAFALAIIGRPELVILDEPTSGLDPQSRAVVWQTVEDLRSRGVSILLTSHLLDEVERVADFVVIVDRGQVAASGTPAQLVGDGSIAVMRTDSELNASLLAAHLHLPVARLAPGQYSVTGNVLAETAGEITRWCTDAGIPLREVTVRRRTLDDVFLDLTGRELR